MECPGMIEKEGQMKPMRKVKMLAFAMFSSLSFVGVFDCV